MARILAAPGYPEKASGPLSSSAHLPLCVADQFGFSVALPCKGGKRIVLITVMRILALAPRTPLIPDPVLQALFSELHRSIEEAAKDCVARISSTESSSPAYPPGGEFTQAELAALRTLTLSPDARAALEKLVTEACAQPVFHLFSLMDGVADPETEVGEWLGVTLEPKQEGDDGMLHDEFFESYWTCKDSR